MASQQQQRDNHRANSWMDVDRALNIAQTMFGGAGLLFAAAGAAGAGGAAINRNLYPQARAVRLLHPMLRSVGGPLERPVLHFHMNPYSELTAQRSLILQGRNREGKTTLLRTAMPWWRRWPLVGYHGIYLNGAHAVATDSFKEWITTEMFGSTTRGGSEIAKALEEYRLSQWFRLATETAFGWPRPKPALVIVDQFEELLKKFPVLALGWANNLANSHTRDRLSLTIFVVNSNAGAQTLLNLNQGNRFHKVMLNPAAAEEVRGSSIDETFFEVCSNNIGMYKQARAQGVGIADLPKYVERSFKMWADDFHVPYPMKYDRSWRVVTEAKMKKVLLRDLDKTLRQVVNDDGGPAINDEEIKTYVGYVEQATQVIDASQVLDATEEAWEARLVGTGAPKHVAEGLAKDIRRILGNPMEQ